MKIPKWAGVLVYVCLMAVCFLPWTYHPDIQKNFTGFFSEGDKYGTPGRYLIIFSVVCSVCIYINMLWAKFTHLFFAGVILAYAIKSYQLYTSTYYAITPIKQAGIYLLILFSVLNFVVAMLPDYKLPRK
jgi:hypothetical protein